MNVVTGAAWSAQQREWLQALGYDVLTLASATPVVDTPRATLAPRESARGANSPGASGSPLMRDVLRAARRRELGDLAAWWPDPATLRGDAAAKRALWPRLRALRRPSRDA